MFYGYMAKQFSRSFYKSKEWEDCRAAFMANRGYLCEDCLKRGIYTPGKEVHHVEELTPANITNPEKTLAWSNLCLLCHECHRLRHQHRHEQRYQIGPGGEVTVL